MLNIKKLKNKIFKKSKGKEKKKYSKTLSIIGFGVLFLALFAMFYIALETKYIRDSYYSVIPRSYELADLMDISYIPPQMSVEDEIARDKAREKRKEERKKEDDEQQLAKKLVAQEKFKPVFDETSGDIEVDWLEWPLKMDYFFTRVDISQYIEEYLTYFKGENGFQKIDKERLIDRFSIYSVGVIKNGKFKDKYLYLAYYWNSNAFTQGTVFRFINDEYYETNGERRIKKNKYIILDNHNLGTPVDDDYAYADIILNKIFLRNDKIKISNLEPPEKIKVPKSRFSLIKKENSYQEIFIKKGAIKKLFTYKNGKYVYRSNDCFYVKANDGSMREYSLEVDFLGQRQDDKIGRPSVLDIIWNNGEKNEYEYILGEIGGCGIKLCYNYVSYIDNMDDLIRIGKSSSGEIFYELKDKSTLHPTIKDKSILRYMYERYYPGWDRETKETNQKIPYESFLDDRPLIIWQDPFGDFVQFTKAKYIPAVECGKPVIYLYPQEETDVSVKVHINGGFSITEPPYNDGWNVKASPDGEIYNYADKETYPYLFWEGKGLFYEMPEKGFVVKKEDVKKFLEEKLQKLGLIKKEYDEFIEFWHPRMQEDPFYLITFMEKQDFDKIAPLEIEPRPDTVIRVFMDYKGLDTYMEVENPVIETPERKGFTVVEWGGALRQ